MIETKPENDEELRQKIRQTTLDVERKCAEWTPKEQYHAWVRLARLLSEGVITQPFHLFPKTRKEMCDQEMHAIKKAEEMRQIIQGP